MQQSSGCCVLPAVRKCQQLQLPELNFDGPALPVIDSICWQTAWFAVQLAHVGPCQ